MLALPQKAIFNYKTNKIFCIYHCVHSHFSRVLFCVILWTVACQAPLSMGFSRHEYWSGLPFPTPGDLLNPGIKPMSLASPALAGEFFTTAPRGKFLIFAMPT